MIQRNTGCSLERSTLSTLCLFKSEIYNHTPNFKIISEVVPGKQESKFTECSTTSKILTFLAQEYLFNFYFRHLILKIMKTVLGKKNEIIL